MNKKSNSLLYIGGSLLLILVAIAITTILSRTSNSDTSGEDLRAKAGVTSTLQVTGTVSSVNDSAGTLVADNVHFTSGTNTDNLGQWTVSAPTINIASLTPGTKVTITIDASTFLITQHTMSATQIKTAQ